MTFNYFDSSKYEIKYTQKLYKPNEYTEYWTDAYGVKTGEVDYGTGKKTDIIKWMSKRDYEAIVNG